jgi:hypothetical protein
MDGRSVKCPSVSLSPFDYDILVGPWVLFRGWRSPFSSFGWTGQSFMPRCTSILQGWPSKFQPTLRLNLHLDLNLLIDSTRGLNVLEALVISQSDVAVRMNIHGSLWLARLPPNSPAPICTSIQDPITLELVQKIRCFRPRLQVKWESGRRTVDLAGTWGAHLLGVGRAGRAGGFRGSWKLRRWRMGLPRCESHGTGIQQIQQHLGCITQTITSPYSKRRISTSSVHSTPWNIWKCRY